MSELHELSALDLGQAIRNRVVSPVEVTRHFLDRIEADDGRLGAFVTVTRELALTQAKQQHSLMHQDKLASPLAGVPVPIKDLNHVEGVPISYGSGVYAGFVAPFDDHVVRRLRAAGTICLGKTSTPEFGLPCYTETLIGPPARTPWDLARGAGGSSGGAAAAVAGGLAPLAQGSDGGGSIRIPASSCGLFGLKPSRGRVSNGPLGGDVGPGLGVIGPIAWTVADAAALLDVMAGPEPGDPHWAPPLPAGETFSEHARREPGRLRIARFRTPVVGQTEVHPECIAAYDAASALLERLGHEVVDIDSADPSRCRAVVRGGLVGARDADAGATRTRWRADAADPAPARSRVPDHRHAVRPGRSRDAGHLARGYRRARSVRRGADADAGRSARAGGQPAR